MIDSTGGEIEAAWVDFCFRVSSRQFREECLFFLLCQHQSVVDPDVGTGGLIESCLNSKEEWRSIVGSSILALPFLEAP